CDPGADGESPDGRQRWSRRPSGRPRVATHALRHARVTDIRARARGVLTSTRPRRRRFQDADGRNGPVTTAIDDAMRRAIALGAPNPQAAGGIDVLRAAGVAVETEVLADEAYPGLRFWLTAIGRGRPYVIWKYAATLDGRVAAADGTSQWITSPEARA